MTSTAPRVLGPIAVVIVLTLAGCATPMTGGTPALVAAPAAAEGIQRTIKQSALSDAVLTALVPAELPGCSAAVAVRGDVIWAGARGLADLATGAPLTTQTRFDMASISKQFTATAILLLQREGLLSVNDPISRHVDGLPAWADTVTIDELLHHTARVPDFWMELEAVGIRFADSADQTETLAAIARERELEVGDGYLYSNSHYVLLAEVVARVSGQPLPTFLNERVFAPLGLAMTLAPGMQAPDIARSYEADLTLQPAAWTAYGHAGIITTPTELARWGDQYRAGGLVDQEVTSRAVADDDGEQYGAGIRIASDGDLYHSGRWGGYISDFTVSADRDTVIVVVCNGRGADRFGVADALEQIWRPASADE